MLYWLSGRIFQLQFLVFFSIQLKISFQCQRIRQIYEHVETVVSATTINWLQQHLTATQHQLTLYVLSHNSQGAILSDQFALSIYRCPWGAGGWRWLYRRSNKKKESLLWGSAVVCCSQSASRAKAPSTVSCGA